MFKKAACEKRGKELKSIILNENNPKETEIRDRGLRVTHERK